MSVKFANNAFGTLNAGISNSATSLTLSSGQGARFPTLASGEYFYATLIDTSNNLEVVKCTARSTDVLTVTRAQESTTAQAFAIGDRVELRVTAQGLDDAANPYDKDTSSTGSLALPVGTTAQQPTAADTEGHIRYDSDDDIIYYSNGTDWLKISSVIPILSSVTGSLLDGVASTLTLAGTGFLAANLTVTFFQAADSVDEDVVVTPTSDTAATVAVPAAVYNNVTAGNVVSITVTNSDNVTSPASNTTVLALPSGGTVTTSGSYRIHTFTSSGTFTNTISSLSTEYLIVAGGGGGMGRHGGGGGGGGYRSGTTTPSVSSHAVSIGAGGASAGDPGGGSPGGNQGGSASQGGNSSVFSITSTGGGGGSTYGSGGSGGSGGGGGWASSGGSGTSGQGNSGGNGASSSGSPAYGAGGGGGAGSAGGNGSTSSGGNGGNGSSSSISGSSITYAGGGKGGSFNGSDGSNGSGGGNTANRGGGGQGAGSGLTNGGSGVVIIRYQL